MSTEMEDKQRSRRFKALPAFINKKGASMAVSTVASAIWKGRNGMRELQGVVFPSVGCSDGGGSALGGGYCIVVWMWERVGGGWLEWEGAREIESMIGFAGFVLRFGWLARRLGDRFRFFWWMGDGIYDFFCGGLSGAGGGGEGGDGKGGWEVPAS